MKTLCKNRTAEETIRVCNSIIILLAICILTMVVFTIIDLVQGQGIDSSRILLLCADVCILSLNMMNKRNAMARLEAEKLEQNNIESGKKTENMN